LRYFGGFARVLDAARKDLLAVPAVGAAVADAILAARAAAEAHLPDRAEERLALSTPGEVAEYCRMRLTDAPHEAVAALLLDAKQRVETFVILPQATGGRSAAFAQELAACALADRATGIVLAHNQPSGSPEPSGDDLAVTRELKQAVRAIGVQLLDHLVISRAGGYYSFAEAGLL
ncbi:MAG: JAB domain-containing protein, partial [Planctomycetes bacterium]|nr:JAB domain-containing protein [Planctomycetota bacterium]